MVKSVCVNVKVVLVEKIIRDEECCWQRLFVLTTLLVNIYLEYVMF